MGEIACGWGSDLVWTGDWAERGRGERKCCVWCRPFLRVSSSSTTNLSCAIAWLVNVPKYVVNFVVCIPRFSWWIRIINKRCCFNHTCMPTKHVYHNTVYAEFAVGNATSSDHIFQRTNSNKQYNISIIYEIHIRPLSAARAKGVTWKEAGKNKHRAQPENAKAEGQTL